MTLWNGIQNNTTTVRRLIRETESTPLQASQKVPAFEGLEPRLRAMEERLESLFVQIKNKKPKLGKLLAEITTMTKELEDADALLIEINGDHQTKIKRKHLLTDLLEIRHRCEKLQLFMACEPDCMTELPGLRDQLKTLYASVSGVLGSVILDSNSIHIVEHEESRVSLLVDVDSAEKEIFKYNSTRLFGARASVDIFIPPALTEMTPAEFADIFRKQYGKPVSNRVCNMLKNLKYSIQSKTMGELILFEWDKLPELPNVGGGTLRIFRSFLIESGVKNLPNFAKTYGLKPYKTY